MRLSFYSTFITIFSLFFLLMACSSDKDETIGVDSTKEIDIDFDQEMTTTQTVAIAERSEAIYDEICFVCHDHGLAGAPKLGDKKEWSLRLAQGYDVLYDHTINGYTSDNGAVMPAKGGRPDMSDEDIKATVDYMIIHSQ